MVWWKVGLPSLRGYEELWTGYLTRMLLLLLLLLLLLYSPLFCDPYAAATYLDVKEKIWKD
jgi:hypothetical protein